jgi:cardiolipin synthase
MNNAGKLRPLAGVRERTPRVISIALFVVIQAGVLITMFLLFRSYFAYYYVVCIAITIGVTLHIARSDSNPAYKIAWIIPLMLFPIFGGLFYLVYGKRRPTKRQRENLAEAQKHMTDALSSRGSAAQEMESEKQDAAIQSRYITEYALTPPYRGTRTKYFPLGEDMFEHMVAELECAERFIFMEYFIIREGKMWNTILDILVRKAAQGVDVRLIYDDIGCLFTLPKSYEKQLEAKGIRCCVFNRFNNIFSSSFNNRDHRKICVIDGNVGYTGGINLADEYINNIVKYGHWKDSAIALRGEAVWSLTCMFLSYWELLSGEKDDYSRFVPTKNAPSGGYIQPYYDTPVDDEQTGENVYMHIIARAKKYVYITTPYLIIGSEMMSNLTSAAKSGLDVRIITPAVPDKKLVYAVTRSYYEPLLKAGVRIYEYTPGFIHAKNFVCDDEIAVVGTINLDFRSLYLHHECGVWMYDDSAVYDVREDFEKTLAVSREVHLSDLHREHGLKWFFMSILRIFAPLM